MTDWILLKTPPALLLYGLSLLLWLLDRLRHGGKGWLAFLCAAVSIAATSVLLLYGAPLWEAAALLLVFLLLFLGGAR